MIERQIAGESPAPYEIELVCKDGRRVAVEVSTHIIYRDGTPVGVQGIARDITERKKTEEALQQAKQNLEAWVHELEQRTREMTLLSEMGDMLRACLYHGRGLQRDRARGPADLPGPGRRLVRHFAVAQSRRGCRRMGRCLPRRARLRRRMSAGPCAAAGFIGWRIPGSACCASIFTIRPPKAICACP